MVPLHKCSRANCIACGLADDISPIIRLTRLTFLNPLFSASSPIISIIDETSDNSCIVYITTNFLLHFSFDFTKFALESFTESIFKTDFSYLNTNNFNFGG